MTTHSRSQSPFKVAVASTIFVALGLSTFWGKQLVDNYGWKGALRYIWEGDPNPEHSRDHLMALRRSKKAVEKYKKAISVLEEGLERARLDTVDDSLPSSVLSHWQLNVPESKQDLRKHLALLSHELDALAAQVDQVSSMDETRKHKKTISREIVLLMERADTMIAFFQSAQ